MIHGTFPALPDAFYGVLCDRIKEHMFTDNEFTRAVKHVIDTCGYATPRIADFITFIHPDGEIPKDEVSIKEAEDEAFREARERDQIQLEKDREMILKKYDEPEIHRDYSNDPQY
jgi:hypothetical protein